MLIITKVRGLNSPGDCLKIENEPRPLGAAHFLKLLQILHFSPQRLQAVNQPFVTTVDAVDIAQDGATFSA